MRRNTLVIPSLTKLRVIIKHHGEQMQGRKKQGQNDCTRSQLCSSGWTNGITHSMPGRHAEVLFLTGLDLERKEDPYTNGWMKTSRRCTNVSDGKNGVGHLALKLVPRP